MILRSIRTEGLGCFADAFTAGPFSPGVNIVCAPNGKGKSTLFRALSLGFLEPHRGKSAEMQALRPWGKHLSPQVSVEFENSGRVYRLRKRFLDGASSNVESQNGERWTPFAEGDAADTFLRELLKSDSDRPKFDKPEHWGLAQVLWTTQGAMNMPRLGSNVLEQIRGSVGAQLTSRDAALEARVQEEYLKYYSPTARKLKSGRNGAPLRNSEAERDRLKADLQTAEETLRQFERESGQVDQLRATETAAVTRRTFLVSEVDRLGTVAAGYTRLCSLQRERIAFRDAAQAKHKGMSDRLQSIAQFRAQIAESERLIASLTTELPKLESTAVEARKNAVEAECSCTAAARAEGAARSDLQIAQLADEYLRCLAECDATGQQLTAIVGARGVIRSAAERIAALNAPSTEQVRQVRGVLAAQTDARRRLDLARVTVSFVPEAAVRIDVVVGEQPGSVVCEAGTRVLLPGAPNIAFAIQGVGQFEAAGPAADYDTIRRSLTEQEARLASFEALFGTIDPEVLADRVRQRAELDQQLGHATEALARSLNGHTEASLAELRAKASARAQRIESEHATWCCEPPDAARMMEAAKVVIGDCAAARNDAESRARTAQSLAAEAQGRVNSARQQHMTLQEQLGRARELLAGCTADGLTDDLRRNALDEAALQYDACQAALRQLDDELQRFSDDPESELRAANAELKRVEEVSRKANEDRVRAETRIQSLLDRRPYDTVNEHSERLAVLEEQIAREKRRMEALGLLQQTFVDARAELMASVAAPVERIATDYLEEICGRPIGEIRLTQVLATETVIPAGFDDHESGVEVDRFSGGEREQIFFCTRIALGAEIARRERQMLVLDDVLTFTDAERMSRICRLIAKASERLQLVILTCHPERFVDLPGANRIDLEAALSRNVVSAYV